MAGPPAPAALVYGSPQQGDYLRAPDSGKAASAPAQRASRTGAAQAAAPAPRGSIDVAVWESISQSTTRAVRELLKRFPQSPAQREAETPGRVARGGECDQSAIRMARAHGRSRR